MSSGCVLVVGCGWVVFCVTVLMGEHKRDKICLAVFSSNFGCCKSSPNKSFAIGLNPLTHDLTLYIHHTMNPKLARINNRDTISIISTTLGCTLHGYFSESGFIHSLR